MIEPLAKRINDLGWHIQINAGAKTIEEIMPILQNVRLYDTRIQTLDSREAERFLTSENKNVLVDSFVKWRIIDVRQYFVSVRGDAVAAEARISQTVNDALRANILQGASWNVVGHEIVIIATWLVVCFTLALRLFRWR
jgi:regulator of protease activity HflC (stomatin/prohibitin superfamily)